MGRNGGVRGEATVRVDAIFPCTRRLQTDNQRLTDAGAKLLEEIKRLSSRRRGRMSNDRQDVTRDDIASGADIALERVSEWLEDSNNRAQPGGEALKAEGADAEPGWSESDLCLAATGSDSV